MKGGKGIGEDTYLPRKGTEERRNRYEGKGKERHLLLEKI